MWINRRRLDGFHNLVVRRAEARKGDPAFAPVLAIDESSRSVCRRVETQNRDMPSICNERKKSPGGSPGR